MVWYQKFKENEIEGECIRTLSSTENCWITKVNEKNECLICNKEFIITWYGCKPNPNYIK